MIYGNLLLWKKAPTAMVRSPGLAATEVCMIMLVNMLSTSKWRLIVGQKVCKMVVNGWKDCEGTVSTEETFERTKTGSSMCVNVKVQTGSFFLSTPFSDHLSCSVVLPWIVWNVTLLKQNRIEWMGYTHCSISHALFRKYTCCFMVI